MSKNNKKSANSISNKFNDFLKLMPLDYIFAAFCAGFCFSSFITLLTTEGKYTQLEFTTAVNFSLVVVATIIIFLSLVITALLIKSNKIIPISLLICSVLFGCALTYNGSVTNNESTENIYMNIGIGFIMFLVIAWIGKDDKLDLDSIKLHKNTTWFVAGAGLLVFTILISVASIARYQGYMAHNFDFGIFTQMFENMRTTGLADTTVERNTLMSHFGVHFSPFYYVLLPFYMICPCPETLLVIQAVFVALGVIPVVLICKELKLTTSTTVVCSLIYLLFPTLANGCLYDFHENKFLTVLIMWALYFIVKNKLIGILVFCGLILTVKEDAAIYVMSIALYIILSRKDYLLGGFVLTGALIYFVIATGVVADLGDGVMTDRLINYMPQGTSGFGAVAKTCFSNFGYFVSQIFTADKIMFMFWMFIPVAFTPFISKEKSLMVLLIPMLVVDLMSNWQYQYDVKFQYTYGVAGLLVFMAILVISQVDKNTRNKIMLYSLSMSLIMSFSLFFPRASYYQSASKKATQAANGYNQLISTIPKDAEVTADGFYIPHMYNFSKLYQYPNYYGPSIKTEYLLVSSSSVSSNTDNLATFMGTDYKLISEAGTMQLYQLVSLQ
ncbi:MAG: DUF2079 domain-containing protein [Acutalibacteraceae bacterium]|nr:DUF2079 domain-containing protein [Acutalibacteraceae bacterium]